MWKRNRTREKKCYFRLAFPVRQTFWKHYCQITFAHCIYQQLCLKQHLNSEKKWPNCIITKHHFLKFQNCSKFQEIPLPVSWKGTKKTRNPSKIALNPEDYGFWHQGRRTTLFLRVKNLQTYLKATFIIITQPKKCLTSFVRRLLMKHRLPAWIAFR